jgi:phage tail-like protein
VAEVVLPTFRAGTLAEGEPLRLTLRRGHTGDTYFFDWWEEETDPKSAGTRNIAIAVHDETSAVVTEWQFLRCRLVTLSYSTLDANESSILFESADIDAERVRQIPTR